MNSTSSGITPIEYNVVVKPEKVEEKTEGGLYIPENILDKDQYGTLRGVVVSIGGEAFAFEDGQKWTSAPEVGDTVIFVRYAGTLIEADGEDYRIMKDKDILGVVA